MTGSVEVHRVHFTPLAARLLKCLGADVGWRGLAKSFQVRPIQWTWESIKAFRGTHTAGDRHPSLLSSALVCHPQASRVLDMYKTTFCLLYPYKSFEAATSVECRIGNASKFDCLICHFGGTLARRASRASLRLLAAKPSVQF